MSAALEKRDRLLSDAAETRSEQQYANAVNPQWTRLLKLLQMNIRYERCLGAELFTSNGQRVLDFLSGYCVHNLGHNHPAVIDAIKDELDRRGPAMLQSHVPERAGELAERLCSLAGGSVKKAFFCSSGSEGVEAAIKFAKAHTRRAGLLYAEGAFHGLTCGALSLMGDPFWKQGFGTLLTQTQQIPFDDLSALEKQLRTKQHAAFFLEPIQGEGGIRVPASDFLAKASALCKRYGTLFVLDEVQTGFFRTGKFLAAHHYAVDPDMIVLAKAMSGGLVPSGAVLMTDPIYDSVYGSLKRSLIHTSTFSENGLAMRVGLAVLDALEKEGAAIHSAAMGTYMRRRLREALSDFEMVQEIRGEGLFSGIVFRAPHTLSLRLAYEAFAKIHAAMFGQVLVMRLFRDYGILAQICGNNFMVLKLVPPLIITKDQVDEAVEAVSRVVKLAHFPSVFWSEAVGLAQRAVNV
ncbi:MAG TPA: aspartate aminotransferase family protein [Bryobacteraceae bacterium]|jgi:ornithine--oxo-acid transaminase|nr:aspartate aminotransferase family protein [Bryobacteraceae bacterium]